MSNLILPSGVDDGYTISRSVRIRGSATASFSRTPASAGDRKKWTWRALVKRGTIGNAVNMMFTAGPWTSNNQLTWIGFKTDNTLAIEAGVYGISTAFSGNTTAVFRDPSAWYDIVVAYDSAQATAANRIRVWVNNQEHTLSAYPSQNYDSAINNNVGHRLGNQPLGENFDGYMTDVHFIDGQALTPSSFGETDLITGVWKAKRYTGTYGTNGFKLDFSDNSAATAAAIGKDSSGNGNNWTPNNISVTSGFTDDSVIDVPTMWADGGNGRGNYATLNPLRYSTAGSLSLGNMRYSNGSNDNGAKAIATIGVSSGKWYWESVWVSGPAASRFVVGFASSSTAVTGVSMPFERDGSNLSMSTGDTANIAIDFDAGKIWFGKNGVWLSSGDPTTGANATITFTPSSYDFLYPGIRLYSAADGTTVGGVNFGQRPFAYTPPTGYKALHTGNLPEPTIKKGNAYFDVSLYTGNGSTLSVANSGAMQPDLVWVKSRTNPASGIFHTLLDSVRGLSSGFYRALFSNSTDAEDAPGGVSNPGSIYGGVSSFNSNGFTLSAGTSDQYLNKNGTPYVAWQWKEGATPGFDIVTYAGTGSPGTGVINHSLGVAPSMVIIKQRNSGTANWMVKHRSLSSGQNLYLNGTNAQFAANSISGGGIADLTSSTQFGFISGTAGVGDYVNNVNGGGGNYVAYLFAPVAGFSAFGSYTGNGSSTDGPFVFCGFRPRFILFKRTDGIGNWYIFDTTINTVNVVDKSLLPNASGSEVTNTGLHFDIVSNGFKIRNTNTDFNANGGSYVYAAFAENPFKYSLAR